MDLLTHIVVGTLICLLFFLEANLDIIFLAIFFSILPDLDIFIAPLKNVFNSKYFDHRGGSHSYLIGLIISAIVGIIISIIMEISFLVVWSMGVIFYSLHISMDILTTTKIPFLFPLSKKEYSYMSKRQEVYSHRRVQ